MSTAVRDNSLPELELRNGFPSLELRRLSGDRLTLWQSLPGDYRKFLARTNGGWADEFRYAFATGVPWEHGGERVESIEDSPREFFGFRQGRNSGSSPGDLFRAAVEYADERFLPELLTPIVVCASSSLVCLSLREDSYGSVWYWDWYWRYPWRGDFYTKRIDEVRRASAHLLYAEENPESADHAELTDALNFATIVRLADSFTNWMGSIADAKASGAKR